jgi:bifunctional non-homologous end joining protein LigD
MRAYPVAKNVKRRTPSTRRQLTEYERKRDFGKTPEPPRRSRGKKRTAPPQFVVQQHAARRLHYDFRLELDGVLKSWAVPKGPSLDSRERRMAVETEDHPIDYAAFEGVIPKGEYGGGTVMVWDRGRWEPIGDPHAGLAKGKLEFRLFGENLRGRWHLVRMRPRPADRGKRHWLLIKANDDESKRGAGAAVTERVRRSVLTGRGMDAIARDAPAPELPHRPLPRTIEPQLATLVDAPPEGSEWIHEIKLDGYRILARIERGKVRLLSRSGRDWTAHFPKLAAALATLPAKSALLDGEAVVLDERGRSRFQLLQNALGRPGSKFDFYAFDLLHLDGFDLRGAPLLARKELLRKLLGSLRKAARIHYSEHVEGGGAAFLAQACSSGAEGILCKLAHDPYRSGRTRSWRKVKCSQRQEFVIVGFTRPRGSRVGLGALLLAVHDEAGALRYAGKVGTGFSDALLGELRRSLEKLERKEPPVVDPRRAERAATWVEPKLVAEVSFTEWTDDGRVRHPAFIALRSDKPPSEIRRERPEPPPKGTKVTQKRRTRTKAEPVLRKEVAGVVLSNPGRVYFPDIGVTKSELAEYYETMAERVLPGLALRPLTLVRCPNGCDRKCFYQKHAGEGLSERVGRVTVDPGEEPYTMVRDLASVIALVQIAVIEFHVWGARADDIERPDLLVFDLDPGPGVGWRRVGETALLLRELLADLGLVPFLRTTGGKGLHVVTPIVRRASWEQAKTFTRNVAVQLVKAAPGQFTSQLSKSKRSGRILIDYLRNQRDATAIASYSVRARPGAPVAMPIAWDELDLARKAPPTWSVREAPSRLGQPDPWRKFETSRRVLTKQMLERVSLDR